MLPPGKLLVLLFQPFRVDRGVDLSGGNPAVAQKLLQRAQVDSPAIEMSGKAVAKGMGRNLGTAIDR